MSKYKLIKKYPGSPELGTIVNYSEKHKVYNHNSGDYHTELPKHQVEKLPEYWEKVKERDYEILKVKSRWSRNIYDAKEFTCDGPEDYYIHSVRRKSDDEVFTVGDKIKSTTHNDVGKIHNFKIDNSGMRVSLCKLYYHLSKVEHVKKPLFTTEDGVDIYEGDKVYKVANSKSIVEAYTINMNIIYDKPHTDYWLYFSTEEKAKEYIDQHEPRYSKADIKEIVDKVYWKARRASHPKGECIDTEVFFQLLIKELNND